MLPVVTATEAECRKHLESLRWPGGASCPRCGQLPVSRIARRRQFDCPRCRFQFSVTSGTVFHDSHLPLSKWFVAVFLLCASANGMSANQLRRTLKVSYKTAWYLSHRIRAAVAEAAVPAPGRAGGPEWRGRADLAESAFSMFKRSMVDSFHQINAKHLDAYLNEFAWRVNNRTNPHLLRDTLLKLLAAPTLRYRELTA